ncbi:MAG: hypothetical protein AB7V46_23700, partial [Thermomicrobiales bacterium]
MIVLSLLMGVPPQAGIEAQNLRTAEPTSNSPSDVSATDAELFQSYKLAARAQQVIYGPASGALPHDPTSVTLDDSGVSVSDFWARVECVAPDLLAGSYWDCGFRFRDLSSNARFTLGVVSDGSWFFELGSDGTLLEGMLDPSIDVANGRMMIDIIAVGSRGYFAINDAFVSALDISAVSGPGTVAVATSFYEETYVPGGSTLFENFAIVSLDTAVPQGPATTQAASSGAARSNGADIASYSDPAYGFSLTWDSSWSVVDPVPGQAEGLLRLTNGLVTADVYGQTGGIDATSCVNKLLAYYQTTEGYSNAAFVLDGDGAQMLSADSHIALGLITFTFNDSQGTEITIYDYVMCATSVDGQSLVVIEQYVAPNNYAYQLDAMNALQLGLTFEPTSDIPGVVDHEPATVNGGSFTHPTDGYTLRWDGDWSQQTDSESGGANSLVLTSDRATAVLSSLQIGAQTATDCFQALIDGYSRNSEYSNVRFVVDEVGHPIMTEGEFVATALLQYGHSSSNWTTLNYDYVLCARMPGSDIMVVLEQFVLADEFIHVKPEMEALQGGLWLIPEKAIAPPGLPGLTFAVLPVSDADRELFMQIVGASDGQPPMVGPKVVDLIMQGTEYAAWNAGVAARDVRVHVELAPPAGELDAD